MSAPRHELAAALAEAGPVELTVWTEEPATAPGLPALVVRPGAPYRGPAPPPCAERWRLEVVALVPIDAVLPLDALDQLIALTRDVIASTPMATYNGVRQSPALMTIAGKPHRSAVVELDIDTL